MLSISIRIWTLLSVLCLLTAPAGAQEQPCLQGKSGSTPLTGCPSTGNDKQDKHDRKIEPRRETIAVTGTFGPVAVENIDRSVSVIEVREQSLLYRHWVELLQQDPALDLRQRAPSGIQGDLSIRGSSPGQTLILLNGLRMNDVQTAHHNLDLPVPTQSIERIEVLRGAGSTLYGSDAVAGSVNFITAPPKYSEFRAGTAVGNFGVNQQTASASFIVGKWDQELGMSRDFSSGFRPDRDYRSSTAFSNTGLQTSLGRTLLMLGYGDKPFGADQFYGNFNSWERTKAWLAGLKQDLGRRAEFDFGYRRHTDEFILFRDNPAFYENSHIDESWQTAMRMNQPLGRNATLFYGGEGFHESIDSNNLGQHARNRGAAYVGYDVRAWKRYSFSVGAREEILSSTHGEFSPSIAGGVWLKAGWKLKASASRAFRLPTYTDLDYHDPANLGNPTLLPETAWSHEGSVLWDRGGLLKVEATVFERREKNDIDYVLRDCAVLPPATIPPGAACSPGLVWHAENFQRLNFTGVETSVELRLPCRQRVDVSYSGLHGAQESLNGVLSRYVFNYPVNQAVVAWHGSLPGNLVARTRIGVVDRLQRDPYPLWDAAVGREFSHVAAHLSFANLTNTHYEEIQGVVMPGRSVLFGLEFFMRGKGR